MLGIRPASVCLAVLVLLTFIGSASGGPSVRLTTDTAGSANPKLSLDHEKNVVVVWQDTRFGNSEIMWQKFTQLGVPISIPVRVTNNADNSVRPDVACDASGTSHIVWQEGENVNGVGTVYFCRLDSLGAKTLPDVLVKDFSGSARVTIPSTGVTDIVWHRFSVADQDVYYRRYNLVGTQACERRFNAGTIPAIAKTPVACSASNGDPQLFWRDMTTSFQLHIRQGAVNSSCAAGAAVAYGDAQNPTTDVGGAFIFTLLEVGGNIFNWQGAPNACKISQGSGTSTRPAVGATSTAGYAVWQDTRDGNAEIYFCSFWGCTNQTGDVRLTNHAGQSLAPDLAVDDSGTERWVTVWQDDRDGNMEIYLTSQLLSTFGSISGVVRDTVTGALVGGVEVELSESGSVIGTRVTAADGAYEFATVTPGSIYSLAATKYGYTPYAHMGITVSPGAATVLDVDLDPLHLPGTVSIEYWPQHPDEAAVEGAWKWGRVDLVRFIGDALAVMATDYTDESGTYDIHFAAAPGDFLRYSMDGPYVVVALCNGVTCSEVPTILLPVDSPGSPMDTSWRASDASNAYYHTARGLREFWSARFGLNYDDGAVGPAPKRLGTQVLVEVNAPARTCNPGEACTSDRLMFEREAFFPRYSTARSSDAIYHEVAHIMVVDLARHTNGKLLGCMDTAGGCALDDALWSIHEGLADYCAATLNNDPSIVDRYEMGDIPFTTEPMRRINLLRKAPASDCEYDYDRYDDSTILSGALWTLRGTLDGHETTEAVITDQLVVDAIVDLQTNHDHLSILNYDDFQASLRGQSGGQYAGAVDQAFAARNVPRETDPSFCPPAAVVTATRTATGVQLTWTAVPGVSSWRVWRREVPAASPGIGPRLIAKVSGTDHLDESAVSWKAYQYVVSLADSMDLPAFYSGGGEAPADFSQTTGVAEESASGAQAALVVTPNPIVGALQLQYSLPVTALAVVELFDVAGRRVARLCEGTAEAGRSYSCSASVHEKFGAGVYFVRLRASGYDVTKRVVWVK